MQVQGHAQVLERRELQGGVTTAVMPGKGSVLLIINFLSVPLLKQIKVENYT